MSQPLPAQAPALTNAWAELSSDALARVGDRATLVIPIGATEQHGPHLPVGVDAMVAQHVATAAAARAHTAEFPVLVAPVLSYGASHHHLPRAGTLSLSSTTMLAVLRDLLATAAVTGVRRLLLLNGHGGNEDLARQAVRDTALDHRVVAAAVGYWSLAWDDIRDIARRHGIGPVPGHAGSFEASLMLALRPALVSAAPARRSGPDATSIAYQPHPLAGPVVEQHRWVHRIGGYSDDPAPATAEAGTAILARLVDACAAFLSTFARTPLEETDA